MSRLPTPGSDNETWGNILNSFLSVEHNADGTLKTSGSLASKVAKSNNIRYVNDYLSGDTTAFNCSPFIQQAINDAGAGGTIILNGRYRCDTELQLLNFQTVQGTQTWHGSGGAVTTNCLDFRQVTANAAKSNQKVGIRLAASNVLRDFIIGGPGSNVTNSRGISSEDAVSTSPRLHGLSIYNWERGLHSFGGYYVRAWDCEFNFNAIGIYADACYDFNLFGPRFKCISTDGTTRGIGIYINAAIRGLVVHGGSIEQYATAIQATSGSSVSLFGTYFEQEEWVSPGCIGIDATSQSGVSITVEGCLVYLAHHIA